MRKPILMVVLTVVAVACGTAGDMVGEILDSGVPDADASIGMDGSTGGTSGAAGTNGSAGTNGTGGTGGSAGTNGTGGTGGSPGADVSVSCDKSDMLGSQTIYWAEFPISTPGETEVTVCHHGDPDLYAHWKRDWCNRGIAQWYEGTSTGIVYCGSARAKSITVHN